MTLQSDPSTTPTAIEGMWNFRDVGGSGSAVTIKPGLLFRSSQLNGLTATGAQRLQKLGITDVYDLRSHREIARDGADQTPGGVRVHHVPFTAPAPGQEQAPHEIAYRQMILDNAVRGRSDPAMQTQYMLAEYRRFSQLPGTLAALKAVADQLSSGATCLIHCAAGKDRTGILIGVLLDAIGITRDEIIEDYLLSNDAIDALREYATKQILGSGGSVAQLKDHMLTDELLGVRKEYLEAGFDQVTATFGSSSAMLTAAGIDPAALAKLRAVLAS